jgi:hypothetical protein
MPTLRYTLVADGSSDTALTSIIDWLIADRFPDLGILGEFAHGIGPVGLALERRIPAALRLFPCDLLIIHRDAEGDSYEQRLSEVEAAVGEHFPRWLPLIPVRMTEAWLLSDEAAIRSAAENKSGRVPLNLPLKRSWEQLRDPKEVLFAALLEASEKSPRALRKFNPARQRALVAGRTSDFSALRGLPSFDEFESKLVLAITDFL